MALGPTPHKATTTPTIRTPSILWPFGGGMLIDQISLVLCVHCATSIWDGIISYGFVKVDQTDTTQRNVAICSCLKKFLAALIFNGGMCIAFYLFLMKNGIYCWKWLQVVILVANLWDWNAMCSSVVGTRIIWGFEKDIIKRPKVFGRRHHL